MTSGLSRRDLLTTAAVICGAGLAGGLAASATAAEPVRIKDKPFGFSLNTSTIRGQEVGIVREVEIAAEAGYDAIEPWMGTLDEYVKIGGSLKEVLRDLRLAGFRGFLSLELFNSDYWKQDPLAVAKTGLEKMKSVVAQSLEA